jgi:hypothetical protein
VGTSYAWGANAPDGWAIWVRAQPTAPILRFGPGEREKARRLFEQLELLEERASDQGGSRQPVPSREPPDPHPSEWPPPLPLPPFHGPLRVSRARSSLTKLANGVIILAVLAALAAVAALVTQMPRDTGAQRREAASAPVPSLQGTLPTPPGSPSDTPTDDAPAVPGVRVFASSAGGYLFSYPDSWTVTERGTEVVLTSPDGAVRVVFGRTPGGPLSQASEVLVEQVMRSHAGVHVLSSSRESTEQGLRTVLVGGTVDQTERFLAISVEGHDDNKAITVFFPEGRQPPQILRAIRAVIASYRVSTQA